MSTARERFELAKAKAKARAKTEDDSDSSDEEDYRKRDMGENRHMTDAERRKISDIVYAQKKKEHPEKFMTKEEAKAHEKK